MATGVPKFREVAWRAWIVLCSPHSMASKWCFSEITIARSLGKSLFPVIVSPCDLQSVFSDKQMIDLSDENNYQRLWRGLKEAGLEDIFDWDGKRDPYPGLSAFQEDDAALFFGRKEDIQKSIDLLKKIRRSGAERLLLYLGASGSGKSSLVRAGVIPRLKKDQDNWVVVDPFRPNEELGDPFFNLAKVISSNHAYPVASQDNGKEITFSPNAPECGTYIAQYLQNYAGDRCFGRQPDRHGVYLFGQEIKHLRSKELYKLRQKIGVAFQGGALLTSMTVGDNVALPLREHTQLDENTIRIMVRIKLEMVDLSGCESLMPAELSGGMLKRAALARALVMDPKLLSLKILETEL